MLNSHFGAIGIDRGSLKLGVAIAGLVSAIALILMIRDAYRAKTPAMPSVAVAALFSVFLICVAGPYTSEAYLFPTPLDSAAMFGLPAVLAAILFWQCRLWGADDTNVIDTTKYRVIIYTQLLVFITGAWTYIVYHQDYFVNETEPLAVLIASTAFLSSVYTRRQIHAQSELAGWVFAVGNFLMYAPMALGNMSDPYPQADHGYGFPYWIFAITLIVNISYPLTLRRRRQMEAAASAAPAAGVKTA